MRPGPLLITLAFAALTTAGCFGTGDTADPQPETRMPPEPHAPDESPADPMQIFEQFEDRPAGIERTMRFLTGPFAIPPGNDFNRVTVQIPVHEGFLTAVSPNLYDASGAATVNQHMHIHHAHWFRTSSDSEDEYYAANLAWVFGTGEERTQGSLDQRSLVDPDGPAYGIYMEELGPQALIFMLHNKMPDVALVWVALDVNFVYGSAEDIRAAAEGCPGILDGERCQAGRDFHTLHGKLWGTTFDVPRERIEDGNTDGQYLHPVDIPAGDETRRDSDAFGRMYTASADGTAIASAGHLHPNGMEVVVANLGPEGSACEGDLDGDGLPGVTLFHSRKIEAVQEAYPHSEDFQMGATKHGWRAPIRAGDRITQFAVYDNADYASYEAMSFAGLYVDRQQPPAPRGAEGCTLDNTASYLLPGDPWGGDPRETVMNRAVGHDGHDHGGYCGIPGSAPCNAEISDPGAGLSTPVVTITKFTYTPGDRALAGAAGLPIQVPKGSTLTFVNADMATMAGVRHTVTSCEWPCNGPYLANYPQPDGTFDSGKLGNYDPLDGGLVDTGRMTLSSELSPVFELDTSGLDPGYYSFYCRVHPWMRGSLQVL